MRYSIIFILLLISSISLSQQIVEGRIIDAQNKEPLAFVNIFSTDGKALTSTNIDGKFKLTLDPTITQLKITYVGYHDLNYSISNKSFQEIQLQRKSYELSSIEILPGENPAHRIIKQATLNRDKNNPEKVRSYTCTTYSKTYWDLVYNTEEIKTKSDSTKNDSLKSRLRIFSENSHLLMMESVSERKFLSPDLINEKVIATKVSGFKEPSFSTSATDLQPFSFYDDHFSILGKNYLNPITKGSTTKYFFNIEDTLFQQSDTVYIISYKPRKGKNFDGLEGVLYINTNGYAIQNVIASPFDKGLVDIKIQQQYKFIDNKQWFPEQLNYELHYKKYPTKFMGMKLVGKSFISNIQLDPELRKKDFELETVSMSLDAHKKEETFWTEHRVDTLDQKEKKTYHIIDSIGKKQNFDRTLKIFEALTTLQLPVSIISIDLNKIIGLNEYEIVRGGIGLHTNDKLSKWFSVGGYMGYGYADSVVKYGADLKLNYKPGKKDFFVRYSYLKDLIEPAKTNFFYPRTSINRNTMTYRMDYIEQHELSINFRTFKYLTSNAAISYSSRKPNYDYLFYPDNNDSTEVSTHFKSTEFKIKGRYAYKEKLVQALGQLLSDGSDYPVVYFAYIKGFKVPGRSFYDYHKLSLGIEKSFLIKNLGKTKFLLEGAYLKGEVPYSFLFNGNGSSTNGGYLFVENTFQTMGLYEFVSDQYVNLFFSHNFGSLLFKRPKFQPQLMLLTHIGYGSLSQKEKHKNIGAQTMEKGFFESGLFINNILRVNYYNIVYLGLGGGAFMRYGSYALSKQEDNWAYKLSLTITF